MKVCVSVHGRFHAFELAAGLHRRGALARLLTTYPGFAVRRVSGMTMPVRAAWWLEMRRRVPGLAMDDTALARAFGRFAAAHLPGQADLLVGWSAATLEAISPARKMGMKVIIERGSSHIGHQTEVLSAAYAAEGLSFSETSPAIIERETAEYELADAIAVPSAFAAATFSARGIAREKIIVNPYGVDLSRFQPSETRRGGARPRILFVGRVGIRKGIPTLLRAFAPLAGEAELHLVGPLEPAMESVLAGLPMEGVTLRGALTAAQLPGEYAAADIFCLPSLEEGMPLVLLQAMASGVASVATPACGTEGMIEDRREGRIVAGGDVAALTQALADLLRDDTSRQAMAAAARQRIERGWGWDDYVSRAVAGYQALLADAS